MITTIKGYIAYIKDNPEGYWFKRKVYGYGWTPATREGWLVIVGFLLFMLGIVLRASYLDIKDEEALVQVILPLLLAIGVLMAVCYKTGESPRWQWRLPKKYLDTTKD